ncbi:MAG: Hsp20/alpha crystallin family protein [Actinomycetota bacterium]
MLFRSSDLLAEFDRLTRGLNLGSEFDEAAQSVAESFSHSVNTRNVDVVSTPTAFEFHIDLPGVDPSTVELTVDGRTVTVSATRSFDVADDAELVHRGRRHGAFSRTFKLGPDLDPEALTARSEHGVLVVSVPKVEAPAPRKIEITTGE